jgi:hypothetical protein
MGDDQLAERAELEEGTDAALVAEGWASLTPITGVREDGSKEGFGALTEALTRYGRIPPDHR